MNTTRDVSIVLVNYNGKKYIDTLFAGLAKLKHQGFTYEIVFVDNASSDDSVHYIEQQYAEKIDNLIIVESSKNLGFAGGNNLGVSKATGKYIVLLNNDTCPDEEWLEKLYFYLLEHDDVVMVNSKLLFFYDFIKLRFYTQDKLMIKREIRINGKEYRIDSKFCKNALCEPEQIVCFGHTEISIPLLDGKTNYDFIFESIHSTETDRMIVGEYRLPLSGNGTTTVSLSTDEINTQSVTLVQNAGSGINEQLDGYDIGFCEEDGEKFAKPYEINNGCGASIMFKKSDFVECGGFDERFFMYYEDSDLSYRMKRGGKKIVFCPESVVRHIHAGSSGEWSPFFTYHVCKNKLLFVKKNFGKRLFLKHFFQQLISGFKERNRNKLRGTLMACWMIFVDSAQRLFSSKSVKT